MPTWGSCWPIWCGTSRTSTARRGRWRARPGSVPPRSRALVALRNQLAARAGSPHRPATSPFSDQLLDRYPVLDERGGDALGVVPFRRAALAEISADLDAPPGRAEGARSRR